MNETGRPMMEQTQSVPTLKMQVIPRDELPVLEAVNVEGKTYNLGKLLEFRKHPVLSQFLPEETARLSVAWVNLKKGQVLEVHQHPTVSMIIVCDGQGEVMGDCQQPLNAGDVVVVPPNSKHGFRGLGTDGFWALSIQFEGLGLYENRDAPRVRFVEGRGENQLSPLEQLLHEQKIYEKKFARNPLMVLAKSDKLDNPEIRERLLEALNYWSDWFQKILSARVAVGGKSEYVDAAEQHLMEEVGHNKILYEMRQNRPVSYWDPLLDSAASWFHNQMLSGTDEEKTVLMHLVLEGASTKFHGFANRLFPESSFFQIHSTVDEDHFEMGCRLLEKSPNLDVAHLSTVLHHGWAVFGVIAAQMAHHALGKNPPGPKMN
jgi:quercetin dioxygenase-like cupin family protein